MVFGKCIGAIQRKQLTVKLEEGDVIITRRQRLPTKNIRVECCRFGYISHSQADY